MRFTTRFALLAVVFAPCTHLMAQIAPDIPVTFFGKGSSLRYAELQLKVTGDPRIGKTYTIGAEYVAKFKPCHSVITHWDVYLVTGLSNTGWGSVSLPFPLRWDCPLLVSPEFLQSKAFPAPDSCPPNYRPSRKFPISFSFGIPNQRSLIGITYYQQFVLYSRSTIVSTNGCRVRIFQ